MLTIRPVPPFNFDLSMKIFSSGDPEIQRYENGVYWQVISLKEHQILLEVRSVGTVENPELIVDIKSANKLSNYEIEFISRKIVSIFNLDVDLEEFYHGVRKDSVMKVLNSKLRGLNSPTTATFFEAIVSSIIEQQISLKAARSIETRMIKKFGERLELQEKVYYGFPTPKILSKLKKEDLRGVGLSYRKSEYVIGISKCVTDEKIDLNGYKSKDANEIIQDLIKIRGIGVWTAELAVIRGLHKLAAVPADDLGLRRAVSKYYNDGKPISSYELRKIAKKWGKWMGLAAFYLIIADLTDIKI